jgi:hypothetical protein
MIGASQLSLILRSPDYPSIIPHLAVISAAQSSAFDILALR